MTTVHTEDPHATAPNSHQTGEVSTTGPDDGLRRAPQERSTRQKRALAALLDDAAGFRSAQELHAALQARGEQVGLTTVYNQLRLLAEGGDVDALRADDGETLYRRCDSATHHHHLVCRRCGRAVEVEGPQVERWAARVAAEHHFADVTHTVEILGTCADCSPGSCT